jgi:hypothetical protein
MVEAALGRHNRTCSRSSATAHLSPRNLVVRTAARLLAACIRLNHRLERPSRAIADHTA